MDSGRIASRVFLLPVGLALTIIFVALAAGWGTAPREAMASSITVDTELDDTTVNGNCTLREAIIAANTDTAVDNCPAGSGADIITLPEGTYTLTIAGTDEDAAATGDLDITQSLTIAGAGQDTTIIDGGALDRIFHIHSPSFVEMSDLTIRNGDSTTGNGGGILNLGGLTLTDATVSDNTVTVYSGGGGGISNDGGGPLTLVRSTISGNTLEGPSGSGGPGGGIFNGNGGTLNLTDSIVTGNTAGAGPSSSSSGGGISNGSGSVGAQATLTGSTISHNTARRGGGGISNERESTLIVINSTINGNTTNLTGQFLGDGGGGIYNAGLGNFTLTDSNVIGNTTASKGGGISNRGTGTLTNSIVRGNTATEGGGGIYGGSGDITLMDATIQENSVSSFLGDGGGLLIEDIGIFTISISNSTISGNTVLRDGGGISVSSSFSAVTLVNSTISGNTANDQGGGVFNNNTNNTGILSLTNSTLSDNGAAVAGGGIFIAAGEVELTNTIVANSASGGDCGGTAPTSLGHNMDSDDTCGLTPEEDFPGMNPFLGPLQDNGGHTETHALLPGSPAIDAGDDDACPATDQRGVERPQGEHCDIGAYEEAGPGAEQADLSVDKTSAPDSVLAGEQVTYTLTVGNGGPSDATGVTLTDALPAGVGFQSASADCVYDADLHQVVCDIDNLANDDGVTLEIVVTVDALPGAVLTNTAEVTGNEEDPNPANNTAETATQVQARFGDVNCDGAVNIFDVVALLRHIVGLINLTGCGAPAP